MFAPRTFRHRTIHPKCNFSERKKSAHSWADLNLVSQNIFNKRYSRFHFTNAGVFPSCYLLLHTINRHTNYLTIRIAVSIPRRLARGRAGLRVDVAAVATGEHEGRDQSQA